MNRDNFSFSKTHKKIVYRFAGSFNVFLFAVTLTITVLIVESCWTSNVLRDQKLKEGEI